MWKTYKSNQRQRQSPKAKAVSRQPKAKAVQRQSQKAKAEPRQPKAKAKAKAHGEGTPEEEFGHLQRLKRKQPAKADAENVFFVFFFFHN